MSVLLIAVVATVAAIWATVGMGVALVVGRAITIAETRSAQDAPPVDDRVLTDHT